MKDKNEKKGANFYTFNRKVESQKGFVPPVKSNLADMKKLTPNNVTASKQDSQETVDEYDNQGTVNCFRMHTIFEGDVLSLHIIDLEKICNDLLIPIQLWSTKVQYKFSLTSGNSN